MPELPEVETVRRTLKNFVLNKRIISIDVIYPKIIEDDIDEFKNKVCNQVINDIDRIGKFLIFKLDDVAFVSHLRMEGKYHYVNRDEPLNKHDHIIFNLDDLFISVGIDVGADFSWMSIALPNQQFVGKPYKILHSDMNSLTTAVSK